MQTREKQNAHEIEKELMRVCVVCSRVTRRSLWTNANAMHEES